MGQRVYGKSSGVGVFLKLEKWSPKGTKLARGWH